MSLDQPQRNKMMQAAPAKKEFFFAPTAEHLAEVVLADTLEEATETYHRVKRLINQPAQSTAPAAKENEGVESNQL
jgi:hypothetical protein